MTNRTEKIIVGIVVAGVLLCCVAVGVLAWNIQQSVRECSGTAQRAHPHAGDDVAALIDYVKSDSHSIHDRNRAVWTLGRLRDAKALSVLESAFTGQACVHDRDLCQYELEKAIKLCGGTPNPPLVAKH